MKARVWVGGVSLGLMLALGISPASAQDKAGKQAPAWKPGPIHQQLAARAGEYTTVSTFRIKPGEAGKETKGTAKLTSILDGRFLAEETGGTLLGQPTSGFHLIGYNEAAQRYEATWVYTGSTGMMTLHGKSKDDGKTIEWSGSYAEAGGKETKLNVVTRFLDEDRFSVELYARNPDGSKGPMLETTYTRKK